MSYCTNCICFCVILNLRIQTFHPSMTTHLYKYLNICAILHFPYNYTHNSTCNYICAQFCLKLLTANPRNVSLCAEINQKRLPNPLLSYDICYTKLYALQYCGKTTKSTQLADVYSNHEHAHSCQTHEKGNFLASRLAFGDHSSSSYRWLKLAARQTNQQK